MSFFSRPPAPYRPCRPPKGHFWVLKTTKTLVPVEALALPNGPLGPQLSCLPIELPESLNMRLGRPNADWMSLWPVLAPGGFSVPEVPCRILTNKLYLAPREGFCASCATRSLGLDRPSCPMARQWDRFTVAFVTSEPPNCIVPSVYPEMVS